MPLAHEKKDRSLGDKRGTLNVSFDSLIKRDLFSEKKDDKKIKRKLFPLLHDETLPVATFIFLTSSSSLNLHSPFTFSTHSSKIKNTNFTSHPLSPLPHHPSKPFIIIAKSFNISDHHSHKPHRRFSFKSPSIPWNTHHRSLIIFPFHLQNLRRQNLTTASQLNASFNPLLQTSITSPPWIASSPLTLTKPNPQISDIFPFRKP